MNPSREELLFGLVLTKPAAERTAWLDRECGDDAALRQRLEALLAAHEASAGVLGDEAAGGDRRDELHESPIKDQGAAKDQGLTELVPPVDEAVGQTLGRYKLREKVGEGGCGTVYVAEQTEPVRRRVALKVIKLGMDTREVIARFEAERQALAMMDHPNIAKVLDAGTTEAGRPYFVMELVRGIKITAYCDQNQLSTKERLDLFIKVCQAIQHAHQKGIIHRDIKPSNIMVTLHDGVPVPKVIDFGIAKATEGRLTDATVYTQLQQFIGTPAYMSPEQAEMSGLDIDTRSDIYSLGVLLYELLAGSTPFDAKELMASGIDQMRKTIREKEPVRPSTKLSQTLVAADVRRLKSPSSDKPATEEEVRASSRRLLRIKETIHQLQGDLDWIVMKCIEKDRTRRYDTANGLAADLKRHLDNEPVVARPPSAGYRFQKAFRRNKVAFSAGVAVVLALIAGLSLASIGWRQTRVERDKALNARAEAQASEQKAIKAEAGEVLLRQQAQKQELDARRRAYASDMNLAQQALAVNNLARALELLNRHRPLLSATGTNSASSTNSGTRVTHPSEIDLRGWEWRYLWQQCRSDSLFTLCQKTNRIMALAVSHDGTWVAVGEPQLGAISIWDWRTRQEITSLRIGSHLPLRLAFSPREHLLAFTAQIGGTTTNLQRAVRLWSGATRQVVAELPLGGWCNGLVFSADGQTLITATADPEHQITLWRIPDGKKIATFAATQVGAAGRSLAVTRDLSSAAHGMPEGRIRVINLGTGQERWTAKATDETVSSLVFSPDGKLLASCAEWSDSVIHLWDVASGKEIRRLDAQRGHPAGLVFWPDGKTLAAAGSDQTIRLWDLSKLDDVPPPRSLRGHKAELRSLALVPDSPMLVSGAEDGSVYFWDTTTTRHENTRITLPAAITHTWRFAPDSHSVLTLDAQGRLARWQGASFQEMETVKEFGANAPAACFSDDAQRLAVGSTNGTVQLWDLQQRVLLREFTVSTGTVQPRQFLAQRNTLVIHQESDNTLHEWDLATSRETQSWRGDTQTQWPGRSFSPDGRSFLKLSYDGTTLLRDMTTGRETAPNLDMKNATGAGFSPDGKLFASASHQPAARLWDFSTLQELATFRGYLQGVHSVAFSPDSKRLATGSDGKEAVKLWDLESYQELLTLAGQGSAFQSCAFSPDGNVLAAGNGKELHLWRAPSWEEIAAAEAKDPPAPGSGGQGKTEIKQP